MPATFVSVALAQQRLHEASLAAAEVDDTIERRSPGRRRQLTRRRCSLKARSGPRPAASSSSERAASALIRIGLVLVDEPGDRFGGETHAGGAGTDAR